MIISNVVISSGVYKVAFFPPGESSCLGKKLSGEEGKGRLKGMEEGKGGKKEKKGRGKGKGK